MKERDISRKFVASFAFGRQNLNFEKDVGETWSRRGQDVGTFYVGETWSRRGRDVGTFYVG